MNAEVYKTLSDKEKLMYDELHGFAARLTAEVAALTALLRAALEEAGPPA